MSREAIASSTPEESAVKHSTVLRAGTEERTAGKEHDSSVVFGMLYIVPLGSSSTVWPSRGSHDKICGPIIILVL